MKRLLKSVVAFFLVLLARIVVRKYTPHIVMVTGSVGKTSTKDAVAAVLTSKFLVRKSEKSFNSEFGVPFTILGAKNPWGNPFAWIILLKNALSLILLPNHYPNMLVLEVGADQPGDLARIVSIVLPDAVVVTRLPEIPVHVEAYASPQEVREEEFSPAYALPAAAPLIVSADDPYALELAKGTPAHLVTYGLSEGADVRMVSFTYDQEDKKVRGMQAEVETKQGRETVRVRGSVGKTQLLPTLAALAVAEAFAIPQEDALESLKTYEAPGGRGRLFDGKNGSVLIDDTYNASPAAVEEALSTLARFPHAKRRIAVLGDMLELGRYSVTEHERVGEAARQAADMVVAVGIRARAFREAGNPDSHSGVISYENSHVAAAALPGILEEGDVVLIKGSESIRMERIVEALLAHPSDRTRLVRQEREWKRR